MKDNIKIEEISLSESVLEELIALSKTWAEEDISYGYAENQREDIEGNRIFAAKEDGRIIGYLFGKVCEIKDMGSIIPKGTAVFETEELYVLPSCRSQGIGGELFRFAENAVKSEAEYIVLSTSTKNYRAILHFYIDEVGMEFHSARMFKRVG